MSILIDVQDELAQRLQCEANQRRMSVEELAIAILENAVGPSQPNGDWGRRNQRRLELIRQSTRRPLSEPEQAELDELQSRLDEKFDSFDRGLLKQLEEMKQDIAPGAWHESNE